LAVSRYRTAKVPPVAMAQDPQPSAAIERGLRQLASHNAVGEIGVPVVRPSGAVWVDVGIRVALPNAWMADGVSPNGVRSIEPVTFRFPAAYPLRAPLLTLRQDFDRSLAHVQPGAPDSPPEPCVIDGRPSELLQQRGLFGIVDQLTRWLENAALGKLIDPDHGWEPVRRDALDDVIVADAAHLRGLVTRQAGRAVLRFDYLRFGRPDEEKSTYGIIDSASVALNSERLLKLLAESNLSGGDDTARGTSLSLIVWPGKLPSGAPVVAGDYRPETVTTIAALHERAALYGCEEPLRTGLDWLRQCARKLTARWRWPIAIILMARRPYHLIGTDSTIELCPYIVDIGLPDLFADGDATPVRPAAHRDTVSVPLLRRLSGVAAEASSPFWALLGAGSLGSKIGLHLARAGMAPSSVIDRASLSPHNAARHALVPERGRLFRSWLGGKAKALADALGGLDQSAEACDTDIVSLLRDSAERRRVLPKKISLLVNATASLVAREAIGREASGTLPPVIETMLYADGAVGLVTMEGAGRNPNCLDLMAECYSLISAHARLCPLILTGPESVSRQRIGEGCGSLTMAISDARISMMAAPMAEAIRERLQHSKPPPQGRILVGMIQNDGLSVSWVLHDIMPAHLVPIEGAGNWTVRLGPRAHAAITEEVARWPGVETGGILMGRLSEAARSAHVVDVLPAPPDSRRSDGEFVLGTGGVKTAIRSYTERAGGTLYCLGTWHSHLAVSAPSGLDHATATTVALARLAPSVLLIHTPGGYRGVLADNLTTQSPPVPEATS
jgi:hypothetical protein